MADDRQLRVDDLDVGIAQALRGLGIGTALVDETLALLGRLRAATTARPLTVETDAKSLSMAEFMALPLEERVARILEKKVGFRDAAGAVGPSDALGRLLADASQKARDEHESTLARDIQTSILPRSPAADGLEIAASMQPASTVGGDYYDVLPAPDGAFLAIGDVSGHGLRAGVIAMLLQAITATVVRTRPTATPGDLVPLINDVLFDAVRIRLGHSEHATFMLLRYHRDGRIVFAGAHEDLLLLRASSGRVVRLPTPGTWLSVKPDIRGTTPDSTFHLTDGDTLVLFSDGVAEARDSSGQLFDMPRLIEAIEQTATGTATEIRDTIVARVAEWSPRRQDDVTVVVARYRA